MKPNYTLRRIVVLVLIAVAVALVILWANAPDGAPCHFTYSHEMGMEVCK